MASSCRLLSTVVRLGLSGTPWAGQTEGRRLAELPYLGKVTMSRREKGNKSPRGIAWVRGRPGPAQVGHREAG